MYGSKLKRRIGAALLGVVLMLGLVVVAAAVYDHSHADRLADGIRIDGVAVGGLSSSAATRRVRAHALRIRRRDLYVRAAGTTFKLPAGSVRVTADVDGAVARMLADSRRGWFGSRAARDLTGGRLAKSTTLRTRYAPGVIPRFVAKIAAATNRKPVDASVKAQQGGLQQVAARDGAAINDVALRERLASAVLHPTHTAHIDAAVHPVVAKVTKSDLKKKYPAFIIIDRKAHELRFYDRLALARTYSIAVGRAGLETPAGLYDIQWKEVNPPWHVPNSAWAGALAGTTVPPGPDDPIKSRWMAFDGGAGIHGIDPSEYSSIGHDASHGCVRMRIPDVVSLYSRSPVGTPVYVS